MGAVILDLCSGSGAWSKPYREAGYEVRMVDLPTDVRTLRFPGVVRGILAAPPCTVFAACGYRTPRSEEDYRAALSVVDACLRLVVVCKPQWWALENPQGRLVNWLGPPALRFDPWQYGDGWNKRTALWGSFTLPAKNRVALDWDLDAHHNKGGKDRPARRATTPAGFALQFFLANP